MKSSSSNDKQKYKRRLSVSWKQVTADDDVILTEENDDAAERQEARTRRQSINSSFSVGVAGASVAAASPGPSRRKSITPTASLFSSDDNDTANIAVPAMQPVELVALYQNCIKLSEQGVCTLVYHRCTTFHCTAALLRHLSS
jgi:hypothetical protein